MTKVRPPRGTRDMFESDLKKIEHVQGLCFSVARSHGFLRVDTPMFEHLDIFELTAPFSRDKCYVFSDKSGRELTLRPDIMAPISRLIVNNYLRGAFPVKLFFADKVFRYRHGKRREFRLFGLEIYGSRGYDADAEATHLAVDIFRKVGLDQVMIEFSYPNIYALLVEEAMKMRPLSLEPSEILHQLQLCKSKEDIQSLLVRSDFSEKMQNLLLRMLLCENEACGWQVVQELAGYTKSLAQAAADLTDFSEELDARRLKINSAFDIKNLHGLGYYSGLTYRINTGGDSQPLADGGRYDTFIQKLCGKSVSATGIAFGIERLIRIAESRGVSIPSEASRVSRIVVASTDKSFMRRLRPILYSLRQQSHVIEEYSQSAKLSQAIRYAQARNYDLLLSFDQLQNVENQIVACVVRLGKDQRMNYVIDDTDEAISSFFEEVL